MDTINTYRKSKATAHVLSRGRTMVTKWVTGGNHPPIHVRDSLACASIRAEHDDE